jgi:hypothetical protein
MLVLDARQLAEQLGDFAVVVLLHRVGELGVALRRLDLQRVRERHQLVHGAHRRCALAAARGHGALLRRALPRGLLHRAHSSNPLSRSAGFF